MLLHSYANPEFEQGVADEVRNSPARRPGDGLGPDLARAARVRALPRVAHQRLHPAADGGLPGEPSRARRGLGITAPIYITANNGGSLSLQTARSRPIDTILSGPASGVVAAAITARPTGCRHFVTVDMGGTSADMSVIQDGEPENTTRTQVGEFPVIVPVVNVSAIGAGGGSIVWVDSYGVFKVGPQSAGASPGPVCYGRGGTEPTVTDCYLLAGLIDGDHFLGGRMKLDREAAGQSPSKGSPTSSGSPARTGR